MKRGIGSLATLVAFALITLIGFTGPPSPAHAAPTYDVWEYTDEAILAQSGCSESSVKSSILILVAIIGTPAAPPGGDGIAAASENDEFDFALTVSAFTDDAVISIIPYSCASDSGTFFEHAVIRRNHRSWPPGMRPLTVWDLRAPGHGPG